jgi:hypothetical protein|nr:MAG TPA: Exonuclease V - a 5' deoxyribonuclease [Caudoviricetes sp.]
MTNREKFKDELDEMLLAFLAVVEEKPAHCEDMDCQECDFRGKCPVREKCVIDWLNAEYQDPPVDWSKVPIDTPVLVSDDGEKWHKRYYAGVGDDGDPKVYSFGQTSWSGTDGARISYEFMRLAEGNE